MLDSTGSPQVDLNLLVAGVPSDRRVEVVVPVGLLVLLAGEALAAVTVHAIIMIGLAILLQQRRTDHICTRCEWVWVK